MKFYDIELVLSYFTSFSSCCGAYYCPTVEALKTTNTGFSVLLVKTEEFDDKELPPETDNFRYDFVALGEHTLIVKERIAA